MLDNLNNTNRFLSPTESVLFTSCGSNLGPAGAQGTWVVEGVVGAKWPAKCYVNEIQSNTKSEKLLTLSHLGYAMCIHTHACYLVAS